MVRNLIKKAVPPIVIQAYRGMTAKPLGKGLYTGPYRSWEQAAKQARGYDSKVILQHCVDSLAQAVQQNHGFERDGVLIEHKDFPYPLLAYLAKAALRCSGPLSVIDFGGGLGSSYHQCKQFFGDDMPLKWQVIEQPNFVKTGQQLALSPELSFHETLESCERSAEDILVVSGVLQYLEDPFSYLQSWFSMGFETLLIDRLPLIQSSHHKIMVQHVPKALYQASYPSWLFSQEKFEHLLSQGGEIEDSFTAIDGRIQTLKRDIQFIGYKVKPA